MVLHAIYDSCSYPGIQCKFYYNESNKIHIDGRLPRCPQKCNKKGNGKEINKCLRNIIYGISNRKSVLIVGHCTEKILYGIFMNVY